MTSAIRRSGTIAAFTYSNGPDFDSSELSQQLGKARFRHIDLAATEEVSAGWVTPGDPSGNTFELDDMDAWSARWLRVRVDAKKLPAERVKQRFAEWARAHGKKPTAKQRREIKDELAGEILPKMLPTSKSFDVLVYPSQQVVLVFAAGKAGRETACKLWRESFGSDLEPLDVVGLSLDCIDREACESVERLSDGLGQEFLRWLWYRWEVFGGAFQVPPNNTPTGLVIDDLLVFAPKSDGETSQTFSGGMPTKMPEARLALAEGCRVAKARFVIAQGSRTWTATIDGETLRMAVKLCEDSDEIEDRNADRAANWFALLDIVRGLYGEFLRVRINSWANEAKAIAEWAKGGE